MDIFLDSANLNHIENVKNMGLLDGVTTNPSLASTENRPYHHLISDICKICTGPVSAEVLSTNFEGMIKEATEWHSLANNIVVKIPLTEDGIKATRYCTEHNIPTNVTLCFNPIQGLIAAKAGATYISPFVGRLDDLALNGMECISDLKKIYENYSLKTKILVASVRSLSHFKKAALIGAQAATLPYSIITQLTKHPLTKIGLEKFLKDAKKIPNSQEAQLH